MRIKINQKESLSDRKQKGFIRIKKTENILMNWTKKIVN